jgi:hypothetical protein
VIIINICEQFEPEVAEISLGRTRILNRYIQRILKNLDTSRQRTDQLFYQIWYAFQSNLGALRLFSEEVSKLSDQLDRDRIRELAKDMADIFGDDPKQVEVEMLEFTPSLENLDVLPDVRQNPQAQEAFRSLRDSKFKSRVTRWSHENPQKSYKLGDTLWDYLVHPPLSGILLRRGAFVTLIGFLEQLIENLLYGYYYSFPNSNDGLTDEEREDTARREAKKANSPADGWRGRFQVFQKLGINIGNAQNYCDELIEMTQRRNLLVHKDGVIDRTYLLYVPDGFIPDGAEAGKILLVSPQYLTRAFDVISVFACAITQSCWRQRLYRGRKKMANKALDLFIFIELRKKHYEEVIELAKVCKQFKLPDTYAHTIQVNQAVAFRNLEMFPEMRDVLFELSEAGTEWWIDVAQSIFQEDFRKVQRLLAQAAKNNVLKTVTPFWPLFEPIKNEIWFQNIFEHPNRGDLPPKKKK